MYGTPDEFFETSNPGFCSNFSSLTCKHRYFALKKRKNNKMKEYAVYKY